MSHKKIKSPKYNQKIIIAIILTLVVVLSTALVLIIPKHLNHVLASKNQQPQEATKTPQLIESTPQALTSPSPTPEVLTGYCLHAPILMYHHIQPMESAKQKGQGALTVDNTTFDSQMLYLNQAGYKTISTLQLTQALTSHTQLPSKSVIITLDDGYDDFYNFALPILQKYKLHADILIPTGLIDNPTYMNMAQLKMAISSGNVSVINHTRSHANLSTVDNDKLSFEVLDAKKQLENLGLNINIFGYPYGTVTTTAIKFLQNNGFIAALSTIPGQTQCDSIIMALRRTRVGNMPLQMYGL